MLGIDLSGDDGAARPFNLGFPAGYDGVILPGADMAYLVTDAATVVMQDIQMTGAGLRHQLIEWVRSVSLEWSSKFRGWYAVIAWSGSLRQSVVGSGKWRLNEGEYAAMYVDAWRARRDLLGDGRSITLEALCSEQWMNALDLQMPTGVYHGFPNLMLSPYRTCTPAMRTLIDDILFPPFISPFRETFVSEQLQQLIVLMIEYADEGENEQSALTDRDKEVVGQVREMIMHDLSQHFSIVEIARRVGMNECRLKRIFHQVMRMGMHEYLIHQRLLSIRNDILTTDIPFKVLFERAMYSSHQSFITGFRRQFGCAPGELRRNR